MYSDKTVLIIDDSITERALIIKVVKEFGFKILEASNGETGVKMAIKFKPDLILMDVVMPGINGFQATKQISNIEELKHIPIIICSSKNEDSDKIWSFKQGAKAYIVKPLMKQELKEKINDLFLSI